jgi:hypothetical protein
MVSLKATVVAGGNDGRFSKAKGGLSVLHGKKQLHESNYEAGKGEDILMDKITVKKGDFLYLNVTGQLFIGKIGIELLNVQ